MKTLTSILLALAVLQLSNAQETPEIVTEIPIEEAQATSNGCGRCPQVTSQHFRAKMCTPVFEMEINPCCPVAYDCPEPSVYSNTNTTCQYKNITYQLGDEVLVDGPCRRGCRCTEPLAEGFSAEIVCSITECPLSNQQIGENCRYLYHKDQCCAVGVECSEVMLSEQEIAQDENVTFSDPDCTAEGYNYFYGDIIRHNAAPCQHCVCSKDFNGPFGPGCTAIDCGLDYRDSEKLKQGCTPLYTIDACCPNDWVCPQGEYIDNMIVPQYENITENYCELGHVIAPPGESVSTIANTIHHISCTCNTPPDFTCMIYPTQEMAMEALQNGILP